MLGSVLHAKGLSCHGLRRAGRTCQPLEASESARVNRQSLEVVLPLAHQGRRRNRLLDSIRNEIQRTQTVSWKSTTVAQRGRSVFISRQSLSPSMKSLHVPAARVSAVLSGQTKSANAEVSAGETLGAIPRAWGSNSPDGWTCHPL